jgi:hypothetical protein
MSKDRRTKCRFEALELVILDLFRISIFVLRIWGSSLRESSDHFPLVAGFPLRAACSSGGNSGTWIFMSKGR